MKEYLDITISVLTVLALASGVFLGVRRFGLKREGYAFLSLSLSAKNVHDLGDVVLISLTVHVENKGDTRINARCKRDKNGWLYNEPLDLCRHAGTLKVRPVPQEKEPLFFDWYSLLPIKMRVRFVPKDKLVIEESDLEQINYLRECQDPELSYNEADFWLEPHESYNQTVFLWLHPGIYAAKAFFLGPKKKHQEEDYWSCQTIFTVGDPSRFSAPG